MPPISRNCQLKSEVMSFKLSNKEKWEYELVKAAGKFSNDKRFVLRTKDGRFGYLMVQGFTLNDDKRSLIWVNRGWVPLESKEKFSDSEPDPQPTVVYGLLKKAEHLEVRKKDRDLFNTSDDFHIIDLDKFNASANHANKNSNLFIEQIVSDDDNAEALYPCPSTRNHYNRPYLTPQKHMEYSTFWGICTSIGLIALVKIIKM